MIASGGSTTMVPGPSPSSIFETSSRKGNAEDCTEKNEAPAWDRGPRRVRFVVSVVFTPTRGVIHPSFPLRGRWERIAKSGEQAPSPSLASLLNSSCETHSCTSLMHGLRQCRPRLEFFTSHLLTNTWLSSRITRSAPNTSLRSNLELAKTDSGMRRCSQSLLCPFHLVPGPQ